MPVTVKYTLTLSRDEATTGTKKVITIYGRPLEVTVPAGVKSDSLMKLSGALQITDNYYGDVLIRIKVKGRHRAGVIGGVIAAVAIACFFITINLLPAEDTSGHVYSNGAIECGADGEPIELVNNPDAADPTYEELVVFIKEDPTDKHLYSYNYVCSDFAETVHNNAEAAGIRAAWVAIDLVGRDEGHACNAFETTDKGLVYIDCTGEGPGSNIRGSADQPPAPSRDAVAYLEIGRKYGLIAIDYAKSLSYSFYQEYMQKWQDFEARLESYNSEIERYNREISGQVYTIGSAEEKRISAWEAELEKERQELEILAAELGESCYEQVGIVADIHINW
jgi:hypothetical protein